MKITVCVRQGLDGEINPFDACAYEAALRIEGGEVTLLSMGPATVKDFLHGLTRLGAKRAVLLCDPAFAGADTLATAYTLALAIHRLSPDLVLCGRQTLVGDTAQTGVMLAELAGLGLITNAMQIHAPEAGRITCMTRDEGEMTADLPALLTVERINTLRLPRLRSRLGEIEVWDAAALGADISRCGLAGSPTRVVKTFENQSGKRKCKWITRAELDAAIAEGLQRSRERVEEESALGACLPLVCTVGEAPYTFARTVGAKIEVLPLSDADDLVDRIKALAPNAVLWGSDARSKRLAATVAARLSLGLCADCTRLESDGETLWMYRPALSGSIIAKIRSITSPAMATVRTDSGAGEIVVGAGYGVREEMDRVRAFAREHGAELAATRKMTDNGVTPYEYQVGLTGKTVSPPVYVAIGISGAVHHIVGMQRAGTVIAINPDRDAPIFDYADFGILEAF